MSERRRAQFGLLSACAVLAGTMTILYRGSRNAPIQAPQTKVVYKASPVSAPVHVVNAGK
jgi:hypothetical protein